MKGMVKEFIFTRREEIEEIVITPIDLDKGTIRNEYKHKLTCDKNRRRRKKRRK